MADLQGRVIACLEARRAAELADLIRRHQGIPRSAPCLREVHHPDAPELTVAIDCLCDDTVTIAIFLTGVGTATLLEAADRRGRGEELLAALARKRIAVRGPKPLAVLRRAGVRVDLQAPPPHTSVELLAALAGAWELADQRVVVQLHGGPNDVFLSGLGDLGAHVMTASPYEWADPADDGPVLSLIADLCADRIDALLGTSASQVEHLFAIARTAGQEANLRAALARVPVAAQGPVCAAAFERQGVPVRILPPTGHMGALVLAVAQYFAERTAVSTVTSRSSAQAHPLAPPTAVLSPSEDLVALLPDCHAVAVAVEDRLPGGRPAAGHRGNGRLAAADNGGQPGGVPSVEQGVTIWLTGLSGAGKSTLACALAVELRAAGRRVEVLDGDEVREHLSQGLGFSKADRDTNIKRIAYVAKLLTRNGVTVITAAISPYREARDQARQSIGAFVEVYLRCPLDELVRRDPKGLYVRALRGEIAHFTGVSDPYEEPHAPEIIIDTAWEDVQTGVARVLDWLTRSDQ